MKDAPKREASAANSNHRSSELWWCQRETHFFSGALFRSNPFMAPKSLLQLSRVLELHVVPQGLLDTETKLHFAITSPKWRHGPDAWMKEWWLANITVASRVTTRWEAQDRGSSGMVCLKLGHVIPLLVTLCHQSFFSRLRHELERSHDSRPIPPSSNPFQGGGEFYVSQPARFQVTLPSRHVLRFSFCVSIRLHSHREGVAFCGIEQDLLKLLRQKAATELGEGSYRLRRKTPNLLDGSVPPDMTILLDLCVDAQVYRSFLLDHEEGNKAAVADVKARRFRRKSGSRTMNARMKGAAPHQLIRMRTPCERTTCRAAA
ncbi:hypothetical protein R1sor_002073 [Riccia sorocarpa]|uniref:Uncharacterized protein n=1 Tax=Riccia sorocarpa TaxID=122646 RepID=A0ABD3GZD8_9MARC